MINHPTNPQTWAVREIQDMNSHGVSAYTIVEITWLLLNFQLFSLDNTRVMARYAHKIPNMAPLAHALKL